MARAPTTKNYNSFLNGKISDGNEFTTPDNALKDMINMELEKDLSLRKRRGLSYETTPTFLGTGTQTQTPYSAVFDWHGAGDTGEDDYAVFQCGKYIIPFLKGGSSLYANQKGGFSSTVEGYVSHALNGKRMLLTGDKIGGSGINIVEKPTTASTSSSTFPVLIRDLEGATEGAVAVDYNPLATSIAYTPTVAVTAGEIVTGDTSGYKAKVLAVSGSNFAAFFIGAHGFTASETFTGDLGGSGTLGVITLNDGMSEEHYYNLINQGWTDTHIATYGVNGTYPSNVAIWFAGKDSSGVFSKAELDKISFGTSPAPKGYTVLDTQDMSREFVDPINGGTTVVSSVTTTYGFRAVSVFAGRAAYLGSKDPHLKGKVFITQLLAETNTEAWWEGNYGYSMCHTVNDLTAEYMNETFPTDGMVVDIPEAGNLLWSVEVGRSLIVFAEKGVWAIQGSLDFGFNAQNYSVNKISSYVLTGAKSVVKAGGDIFFWARSGIYALTEDQAGVFSIKDLTEKKISKEYREYPEAIQESAVGYFDENKKRIYWAHGDVTSWGAASYTYLKGYARNQMTVLDLDTGGFVPHDLVVGAGHSTNAYTVDATFIAGFTHDNVAATSEAAPLKVACFKSTALSPTWNSEMNWGEFSDTDFYDWDDATPLYFDAFTESWSEHLGVPHLDKQISYLLSFFKRTETSFVDNGSGGTEFDLPSSALASAKWDWTDIDINRWTAQQQAYKFLDPYVMGAIGESFDYGYQVIKTKLEIAGSGMSTAIRYDAEDGKDMHLLGYTVVYTANLFP